MPIGASALQSSKIVKNATLKVYPGAPHGLAQTTAYKDTFNTDLLNFIRPDPKVPGGWCSHRSAGYGAHRPPEKGITMTDANSANGPVTVVLVHGAFADGSGWSGVIERLQAASVPVRAIVNPLRGITADSAYVASVFSQIPGRVLAVGHSYGGAIIRNAATNAPNVVGLVFVAAFAPDEDEDSAGHRSSLHGQRPERCHPPIELPRRIGAETAVELYVDPTSFHDVFASDLGEGRRRSRRRPAARCGSRFRREVRSRPGRPCRPGRWSRPATRPPEPTSSVHGPARQAPRSPSSKALT